MEQILTQWGPAGFILGVLILVVRWLMTHIDTITRTNKDLVDEHNRTITELVSNHLKHSNDAMTELITVVKELKTVIKNCARNRA